MRRRVLLSVPLLGAMAGCARLTDPVVHGTSTAEPAAVPSPRPEFILAATRVRTHLARLEGWPGADQQAWAKGAKEMFEAHLRVLQAREPLAGQASPEPWIKVPERKDPATMDAATFEKAATTLADQHAEQCARAADPSEAMLWGSLSVVTLLNARPAAAPTKGGLPQQLALKASSKELASARNGVLGYLHSLSLWLDLAIGRADKVQEVLLTARREEVRKAIQEQQRRIRELKAEPVGPLPGYQWPGPATDARTMGLIEAQVFTACGPVVGLTPAAQRREALAEMVAFGRTALGSGVGTSWFPGWA